MVAAAEGGRNKTRTLARDSDPGSGRMTAGRGLAVRDGSWISAFARRS